MPTTTAVFKFTPGEEFNYLPAQDSLLHTIPVFATNGVSDSNKVSDTMDVETSLRTIVRSWPSVSAATDFATALQAQHSETDDSVDWPGKLISVQVSDA